MPVNHRSTTKPFALAALYISLLIISMVDLVIEQQQVLYVERVIAGSEMSQAPGST
jgi:hypothetical protein